jgi:hypothetical protein
VALRGVPARLLQRPGAADYRHRMRADARLIAVVTVVAAVAIASSRSVAAVAPLHTNKFKTPSGNIACAMHAFSGSFLRCDILSGLKPEPSRRCEGDWTGASMLEIRKAGPVCAGDTVYDSRAPVLAYGRTWSRDGFRCVSRRTGLTCTNRRGHGFFLSRERWRVF